MPLVDYGTVSIPMKNYVIFMCARMHCHNGIHTAVEPRWYTAVRQIPNPLQLADVPRDPFAIGRNLTPGSGK